jgi:hypothetical protein
MVRQVHLFIIHHIPPKGNVMNEVKVHQLPSLGEVGEETTKSRRS